MHESVRSEHRQPVRRAGSTPARARTVAVRLLRIGGDLAVYVLGVTVTITGIPNVPAGASDGIVTSAGVAIALLGILLWGGALLRRDRPFVPLLAGLVLAAIGTDYLLFLIGAHHGLLLWRGTRERVLAVLSVLVVAAFAGRELLTSWGDEAIVPTSLQASLDGSAESAEAVVTITLAMLSLFATFGLTALVRSRRESARQRERADVERDRASALGEAIVRQAERERLARDIHDALAHRLSVISLQSGALEEASRSQDADVARAAQTLRQQAHASLDDLRGLLVELRREPRPDSAADAPADAAPPSIASMREIGHLIRSVREGGTVVDALVLIEDADRAGAALDRTVYRIVQECLTNALKHASTAPVSVYVDASATRGVRIRVSNPVLAHTSEAPGSGRGLVGIRERVQLLGGTAWTGESDGDFVVDVSLPWPADT